MNISGIYKIQSVINPERCYIGSAINFNKRRRGHLELLRRNKHPNNKLQNHFNKYGENDLQFSVLLGCEKEYLIENEQFFIDSYKPWFNICPKAGNSLGVKHTKQACINMGESHRGERNGNYMKSPSIETRNKISKTLTGRPSPFKGKKGISKETFEKMSKAHSGNKRAVGNKSKSGQKYKEETLLKMSASMKEYWRLKKQIA